MAATMTENQFNWKQFASTLTRRECETGHKNDEQLDQDQLHQDSDDASSSTNTRASRALKQKQKQSQQSANAKTVKWSKFIIASGEQPTEELTTFDEPKPNKAKTRAERRAIEEDRAPAPVQKKTRREQRSDYWVVRDDKCRNSAKAMKAMMSTE